MLKKQIALLVSLVFLVSLIIGACSPRTQPDNQPGQPDSTPGQEQRGEGEITEGGDQFDEDGEEVTVIDGTFVGFADNRIVEITVDNEPMTFTVTDRARNDIEKLEIKQNDRVMVKYREVEQGNPEMIAIEKIIAE